MSMTRTWFAWRNLRSRCNNQNVKDYVYYGGRGISYDPRWEIFENFLSDMGECPTGLTIDRIDNDLGYFKDNCRWDTKSIQQRKKRIRRDNTTGLTGVCKDKRRANGKYHAQITLNGSPFRIGTFDIKNDAALAYNIAAFGFYGPSASLNENCEWDFMSARKAQDKIKGLKYDRVDK
jgi:hypothetical protein